MRKHRESWHWLQQGEFLLSSISGTRHTWICSPKKKKSTSNSFLSAHGAETQQSWQYRCRNCDVALATGPRCRQVGSYFILKIYRDLRVIAGESIPRMCCFVACRLKSARASEFLREENRCWRFCRALCRPSAESWRMRDFSVKLVKEGKWELHV